MTIPLIAPPAARTGATPLLRTAQRLRVEFARGLAALTGQTPAFARASTATFTDSAGATVTAPHSRPRRESRMWFDTPELGLRVSSEDLTYTWDVLPESGTFLLELIDLGTAGTSGAGLLYVGNDGQTGARLAITGGSNTYTVTWTNAGGLTSEATFGATVSSGHAMQLLVQVDDDGTNQRVRVSGTHNGLSIGFSAWGTARARSAAWGTGTRLRLNRVGSAGTQGSAWLRTVAYAPGLLTLDDLTGVR